MTGEVERPFMREYDGLGGYIEDFRDYAEWRCENGRADNHHDQSYPLVRECPRCGGVSVISLISSTECPVWKCKTGAHRNYSDNFSYRDDYEGSEPRSGTNSETGP